MTTTDQILILGKEILDLIASPINQMEIQRNANQTRKHEFDILSTTTICPVDQQEELKERLPKLKRDEGSGFMDLRNLLQDQFYNADVLAATMCITDAIIYTQPVQTGSITSLMRIRYWLRNLKEKILPNQPGGILVDPERIFAIKVGVTLNNHEKIDNNELYHELFVGLFGTNRLRIEIPNFAYIYGGFSCSPPVIQNGSVVSWCTNQEFPIAYLMYENFLGYNSGSKNGVVSSSEHSSNKSSPDGSVQTISLTEYCKTCSSNQFLNKYVQVLYAIRRANQDMDFTHYNLSADNVYIRPVPSIQNFYIPYTTEKGTEYVLTDAVATIINYECAHIRYYQGNNQDHFGSYSHLDKFVFPRKSFPLTDAYKLLCTSLISMIQGENQEAYSEVAKLITFFNTQDTLEDILIKQNPFGYNLPPVSSWDTVSLDDFITYVRSECDCSFIFKTPRSNGSVLGCQGTDFCITYEGALHKVGLDGGPATPETVFDFYEMSQAHPNEDLKRNFPYKKAIEKANLQLNHDFKEVSQSLDKLNPIEIRLLPLNRIFDTYVLKAYRNFVIGIAKIYDLLESLNTQITIMKFTMNSFGDNTESLDTKYNELLDLMETLNEYIRSIREDFKYLEGLLNNPLNRKTIDEYTKQYPSFRWYWESLPIFDYILVS